MKRHRTGHSGEDRSREIATELENLFQQQIELTKWEAFNGLTPAERDECDRIAGRIHMLLDELSKLQPERQFNNGA
jgi:hypothetical protein